jgi:NIMA-interacting peptidyl-prolyl cis-trans isomerase 1
MKKILYIMPVLLLIFACGQGDPTEEGIDTTAVADTTEAIPVDTLPATTITARHILICYDGCAVNETFNRTQAEALASIEGIQARILSGEITFQDAAIDYSDCPSGQDGGMLGEFGRGAMVAAFEDAAFALPVGGMSGVVETEFGYHLIYREL